MSGDRGLKAIGYAVLTGAAAISGFFVKALVPSTIGATVFISVWLLLPYLALALLLRHGSQKHSALMATVTVAVLVAAAGLLLLTEVIYLHPDAQGAIAVVFMPIYQAIALAILLPACRWLFARQDIGG